MRTLTRLYLHLIAATCFALTSTLAGALLLPPAPHGTYTWTGLCADCPDDPSASATLEWTGSPIGSTFSYLSSNYNISGWSLNFLFIDPQVPVPDTFFASFYDPVDFEVANQLYMNSGGGWALEINDSDADHGTAGRLSLATAVSEPMTLALMLAGVGWLSFLARRPKDEALSNAY